MDKPRFETPDLNAALFPQAQAKRRALVEWLTAVNSFKEYGFWASAVSFNIADLDGIIENALCGI